MAVKFGTDGWRAVIADEYTFENVRRISKATAVAFGDHPKISNGIVIGYDTRFLSKEFAQCSAEVFANHGIRVFLTDSFVTTPTVSLLTRDKNLAYGVMITSSHNPPEYNGYKLKDEFGGSMGTSQLSKIEEVLNSTGEFEFGDTTFPQLIENGTIEYVNGRQYYIDVLKNKINTTQINNSGLKILYDAMYGSGQGMMESLLSIKAMRSEYNPSFGGSSPEPVQKNLLDISETLKKGSFDIGIATDGDADRIAILDENGEFVDAQKTFALLLQYLIDEKKLTGGVVRGFSSSELIARICEKKGLKLYTVPIGFKYISELMVKEDILIGAEESGGIGLKIHLPERDGIFNGMLFCEMLAVKGRKLSNLISEMEKDYGRYFYRRIDKHLQSNDQKKELMDAAKDINVVAGMPINKKDAMDGFKLFFDKGWVLIRPSGTEPLLRLYCETQVEDKTSFVLDDILSKFSLNHDK